MAKWIIDSDHSCAAFAIRHMVIAHVRGQFNKMKGAILFDPEKKNASSVEVKIYVASLTTGIRKRDDHLLTSDFFDQQKFPTIALKSSNVEFADSSRARIPGDLALHGVTRRLCSMPNMRDLSRVPLRRDHHGIFCRDEDQPRGLRHVLGKRGNRGPRAHNE